jgi:hypothetical protein
MAGSHKEVQFNLIRRKQRLTPTDFLICRVKFISQYQKSKELNDAAYTYQ